MFVGSGAGCTALKVYVQQSTASPARGPRYRAGRSARIATRSELPSWHGPARDADLEAIDGRAKGCIVTGQRLGGQHEAAGRGREPDIVAAGVSSQRKRPGKVRAGAIGQIIVAGEPPVLPNVYAAVPRSCGCRRRR